MGLKCFDFGTHQFDTQFDVVESATLQKTSMSDGTNKFYQMELHHGQSHGWRVFSANGRTGVYAKPRERVTDNEGIARAEYSKLLKSKLRASKGYRKVDMVNTKMGTDAGNQRIISQDFKKDNVDDGKKSKAKKKSTLSVEVGHLVGRLYKEAGKTCQSQLHGSLQTSASNPLGTLSLSQIEEGKDIIVQINALLSAKASLIDTIEPEVMQLTDAFYSAIPQEIPWRPKGRDKQETTRLRDDWMRQWALNNAKVLDEKYDLLDLLGDVKGMIQGFSTDDEETKYKEVRCSFSPVDTKTFDRVSKFVRKTQSRHHSWDLKPKRIWQMNSESQSSNEGKMDRVGSVQELFHGSRAANILGICKKGLLLRPPGAYVTGSLFGNGLYFANQSTKSSQYSTARFGGSSSTHGSTFFMFVADVALGRIKKMRSGDSGLNRAPHGYDSVMGAKGHTNIGFSTLVHDEFIVYDIRQNKLQFLVEFAQSYH